MSDETGPRHIAFEVENLNTRLNYTLVYCREKNRVELYNTSRNVGRKLIEVIGDPETPFPKECANAWEYYNFIYARSLKIGLAIAFLGYVDKDTIEPIDPDDEETMLIAPEPM